jgi:hypothetical protein
MIMSLEKRMEPVISIPLERTLVGLAMAATRDQSRGRLAI